MNDSRLLLVEDNADLLDVSLMMLEQLGYNAIGVSTAEEALSLLEIEKYGVLLTDLTLPRMSGAELIKIARVKYPDLPIIVISGYDRPQELDKNVGFMIKPIMMADMQKAIDSNLH